jgi:hypothetical protein
MTIALLLTRGFGRLGNIGRLESIQSNEFFAKSIDLHPDHHTTENHPTQGQPSQGLATQGRPSPGAKQ